MKGFWSIYSHLIRPSELPSVAMSVFLKGVRPLWEDEANKKGGKFSIRVKKGIVSHLWEDILLAMIGNQLGAGADEICGCSLSVRYSDCDIVSLWTRTSDDPAKIQKISKNLRMLLKIPDFVSFEFKPHYGQDSAVTSPIMTTTKGNAQHRGGGKYHKGRKAHQTHQSARAGSGFRRRGGGSEMSWRSGGSQWN